MKSQSVFPESKQKWLELRKQDVTSTEISALFGISPYITDFELWHLKKGLIESDFEASERSDWGLVLQDGIAEKFAKDNGWHIFRMEEYIRLPELRIGSSFDYAIKESGFLLEIKNVDFFQFKQGWIVDGDYLEAPAHIEMQLQHQLLVSGAAVGYIGALISGNKGILIRREANKTIQKAIINKVEKFWESIDEDKAPKPDFEKDADVISRLYNYAEDGKVIDADGEINMLVDKYRKLQDLYKIYEIEKETIKAELLTKVGNAEKVLGGDFSITAGMVEEKLIAAYTRKAYRNFRVNLKKQEK